MASGRFISSSLGDSERFCKLVDARYQVAFMLIVTWADAEGRFIADPVTLNGKLFTRLGWSLDTVSAALEALSTEGLVTLYDVDGKSYGVIARFHEHNKIGRGSDGRPSREAPSKLPAPPASIQAYCAPTAHLLHSNSAPIAPEVQVQVQVQEEVRPRSNAAILPPPPPESDRYSSEEAFTVRATTGINPTTREHQVRERIRICAGKDFTREHDDRIPGWSREHTPEGIDVLWKASQPAQWKNTTKDGKRRAWIFQDLLNQDIQPLSAPINRDDIQSGTLVQTIEGAIHTVQLAASGWLILDNGQRIPRVDAAKVTS